MAAHAKRKITEPLPDDLILEISNRGVGENKILDAFFQVRREDFVPLEFQDQAYEDIPILIGHGQTTSQPSLIAKMLEALHLTPKDKILEIGTGFGFQTALLAQLCREVFSIERINDLAMTAESNLRNAGIKNAHIIVGDGTLGLPEQKPFDAILVSAAAPHVPTPLINQLIEGGRLVQPIGPGGREIVTLFQKQNGALIKKRTLTGAYFVPLIGTFGL